MNKWEREYKIAELLKLIEEQNYEKIPDTIIRQMKEREAKQVIRKPRPAYICDPAKNTSCTKEGCMIFHFCRCTTDKEFAKTGENNKPIVAVRSDMDEEE